MDSVSAPRRRPVRASRRYPSIGVRVEGGDQRRHLVPPPSLFEFDDNFGEAESSSSSTVSSLNPSDENQDESPFPSEYKFIAKSHSDKMLTGLNSLREIKQFCDVTLIVQGNEIPAHRCVLAAFSPYFKAMFTTSLMEATKSHIPLQGLDYQVVRDLTEFAYSSEIQINKSNVQNLLSAANQLEVTEVRQACCRFMENHLDPSNSVGVHLFAEAYACPELQEKSKRYILRHFCEVVRNGEEFVSLPMEKLVELICSDDLEVDREETVMEAVQSWLKHDEEKRGENFEKVLEQVRLPLLSPYYLIDSVESMPVVQTNPKCRTLIEEAKVYHLLPERRRELQSARTKRRNNAGTIEVIVAVGGEDDKVVLRSVDCFDPTEVHSPSHGWRTLSCLPYALSKHGLVVSGKNMLFLAGGEYPDGTASSGFYRYDPVLDTWVELHSMTVPRSELGLAIVDGFVYAVGGWDGSHRLDSVERYDPTTNTWSFVTPLKMGMTSAAVVVHEGLLYVAGGAVLEDGDGIDSLLCYNSRTDEWTEKATMLIPRSGSAACVLNNCIYVIGGWHASTENTNKVECFDIAKNKWEFRAPMAHQRYRPGVAVMDGQIFVMGGERGWNYYHESIEVYNPESNAWKPKGKMSSPRSWLCCASLFVRREIPQEMTPFGIGTIST